MSRRFPGLQKLILLLGDVLIVIIGAYLAVGVVVFFADNGHLVDVGVHSEMLPVMVIVASLLFNVNGLFSLEYKKFSEIFISLSVAMLNLGIIMMAISFFLREFSYSRGVLSIAMVLQLILLTAWKYMIWRMENAFMQPHNVLVVGDKVECERIITHLLTQPHLQYHVKYVCHGCPEETLAEFVQQVDLVIICSNFNLRDKTKLVHYCYVNNKQIFIVPDYYDVFCSNVDLAKIDDIPVFRLRGLDPTMEQRLLKRLLDVVFSLGVLIFIWPIFLLIAVAIKIDSPGPALYSQIRSGRYGKEFKIYKFRSMRQDAENLTGPVLASEGDQRITRVGHFLRSARLDELPQFINVLMGKMSVVGPRPERPFFVEQFTQAIPEYVYRLNVKPGITGMAQIWGKYTTTAPGKLIYDLIYIQQCNIVTDLVLILQTIRVLVSKSSSEGMKRTK